MPRVASTTSRSRVANFIERRLYQLRSRRSQTEIAKIAGLKSPNMITHFKTGAAKVPLPRVVDLAKALECDVGHLMRLALEQHLPAEVVTQIGSAIGGPISANEAELLRRIREISRDTDPPLTPEADRLLVEAFSS